MSKAPSPLLGFNNNVRHKGRVFHVQTEDSGVRHPHVITHLFMDGGRILKTTKTSYAEHLSSETMGETVRRMMKEQHKAMFVALRDGAFDELIGRHFKAETEPSSAPASSLPTSEPLSSLPISDPNSSRPEPRTEGAVSRGAFQRPGGPGSGGAFKRPPSGEIAAVQAPVVAEARPAAPVPAPGDARPPAPTLQEAQIAQEIAQALAPSAPSAATPVAPYAPVAPITPAAPVAPAAMTPAERPAAPTRSPSVIPAAPTRSPSVVPGAPTRSPSVVPVPMTRPPSVIPAARVPSVPTSPGFASPVPGAPASPSAFGSPEPFRAATEVRATPPEAPGRPGSEPRVAAVAHTTQASVPPPGWAPVNARAVGIPRTDEGARPPVTEATGRTPSTFPPANRPATGRPGVGAGGKYSSDLPLPPPPPNVLPSTRPEGGGYREVNLESERGSSGGAASSGKMPAARPRSVSGRQSVRPTTGRGAERSSIFGDDLNEKSLDEVILSYLAEDLDASPGKK